MIEDVDYLKQNSETDNIAIFADSSLRDQTLWPTPSEYAIEFTQPFRNVIGFDILDAAMPTTMYNIDVYNNVLDITIVEPSNSAVNDPVDITDSMSYARSFIEMFERDEEGFIVLIPETTTYTATAYQNSLGTYVACVQRTIAGPNISVVKNIPPTKDWGNYYYWCNNNLFFRCLNDDEDIIDILKDNNIFCKYNTLTSVWDIVYYTFQNIEVAEYDRITGSRALYISIFKNYRKGIELGNYDIPDLRTELNAVYNPIKVFFESTTLVEIKQGLLRLKSYNYILVNARKRNLARNLGFDLFPSPNDSDKYNQMKIGDNAKIFASYKDPTDNIFVILAPGVVNLMGERFIILRCKEIEDHLYGSFSYSKFIPGIAMFKLGAVNDISNLRFDYVSLVRKPAHPIGKLTKMTLRFETVDGKLYDFKGVNNQMLMMIKFYVPTQKNVFEKSILNPNYDSNFIDYMIQHKSIEYHEISDEEEEFDDNADFAMYKKKLEEFDYSSSDDEENEEYVDHDDSEEQEEVEDPYP